MYYFAIIILAAISFLITKFIVERRSAAVVYGSQTMALLISIAAFIFIFARKIGSLHSIEPWFLIRFIYLSGLFLVPGVFLFIFIVGVLFISRKPSRKYSPILPAIMIWIALTLAFTGVYAKKIEPYWIETTYHTITTNKLEKNSIRIVQLSDIHLDDFGKREKRTLQILKELHPDIILLTGDYLNNGKKQKELNHFMKSLNAKNGVYAVRGNWEGTSKVIKYFEGTEIQLIDNET
ncbi:MAG: metallophosphoesterase [Armatimonadota bacterium]